jgi:hypothetical protein
MSELMAVEGMTVVVDQSSASLTPVAAAIVVDPITGRKLLGSGAQAHLDGDTIQVSGITAGPATIPDPGPYEVAIPATAKEMGSEGSKVLREGDLSEVINATPQTPGSPPVDTPVSFQCVIQVAGQQKVRAE